MTDKSNERDSCFHQEATERSAAMPLDDGNQPCETACAMKVTDLQTDELRQACQAYKVKELYAFGSVVSGQLTATSDLDFLVQFDRSGVDGAFGQFMGFKERLESLYGRPVDLLTLQRFRNPLFQQEIDRSKLLVYAA
jgi:predicted nucleotidyltransferase